MSYLGVGISPGNVAVYHGGKMKLIDRRLRLTELLLRCSVSVLALLALILVVTDTQVKTIFTIEKRAKYTDMKALVLVAAPQPKPLFFDLVNPTPERVKFRNFMFVCLFL